MNFWISFIDFYRPSSRYRRHAQLDRSSLFGAIFVTLLITFVINQTIFMLFREAPLRSSVDAELQNFWISALIITLIAPVVEETAFRLFLGRFDLGEFLVSSSLIMSYILIVFYLSHDDGKPDYVYTYLLLVSSSFGFFLVFYFMRGIVNKVETFWNFNPLITIYATSLLFSLIHLSSTPFSLESSVQVLYLIPMFFFSLVVSFIRFEFGILYCVLFHIALNVPSLLKLVVNFYYQGQT